MKSSTARAVSVVVAVVTCLCLCTCGSREVHHSATSASRGLIVGDYDDDDFYPGHYDDADKDDEPRPRDMDGDTDNKSGSYYDADDSVRHLGHAAGPAEGRTVQALVKRYFVAAAAHDGASACPLITTPLARSVPSSLGKHPPGPAYANGTTCAEVMSKVFKQNHAQLAAEAASLRVTAVRLKGQRGWAVLGFKGLPGRQIAIAREAGVWKVEALLDEELP